VKTAPVGSTWADKRRNKILVIVKVIGDHPDPKRVDDLIVLALDLCTGTTDELVFNSKEQAFTWTKLEKM
jgi:hypothetical protein